jgi:methanogenic corrinoid protein MtbC1
MKEQFLERYLTALLVGDRYQSRLVIEEALQMGIPANRVYMDIIWPIMVEIEKLHSREQIDSAQEAFASRINRTIVDQLQNKLPRKPVRNKRIVICSNPHENAELGGQMVSDMFESDGWDSRFLGGRVNQEDILSFIHGFRPDILMFYGLMSAQMPDIRNMIDRIRSINAFPNMRIMLSGGVFNRAEGLWEEIGADLFAPNAEDALRLASAENTEIKKPQRTIKRRKRAPAESCDPVMVGSV